MKRYLFAMSLLLFVFVAHSASAQNLPPVAQGDFTIRDFKFDSGETLPELRLHYRTLGTPKRDSAGVVRNAVLVMHGTGGSGSGFLSEQFAFVPWRYTPFGLGNGAHEWLLW